MTKDLYTELRELEERKKIIEEELNTKRKIAEKEKEDNRKAFEKKVWDLFNSSEGKCIDDWYDYYSLGYDVISSLSNEGYFYYDWDEKLEKAILETEKYIKKKQEELNLHLERLKDWYNKLKDFKLKQEQKQK